MYPKQRQWRHIGKICYMHNLAIILTPMHLIIYQHFSGCIIMNWYFHNIFLFATISRAVLFFQIDFWLRLKIPCNHLTESRRQATIRRCWPKYWKAYDCGKSTVLYIHKVITVYYCSLNDYLSTCPRIYVIHLLCNNQSYAMVFIMLDCFAGIRVTVFNGSSANETTQKFRIH